MGTEDERQKVIDELTAEHEPTWDEAYCARLMESLGMSRWLGQGH